MHNMCNTLKYVQVSFNKGTEQINNTVICTTKCINNVSAMHTW